MLIFLSAQINLTAQAAKKEISVTNSLTLQLEWYKVSGITQRSRPFIWYLNGNPTIHYGSHALPFSFLLSNYQTQFTQPFNYFGISPKLKWATFHIGYRNLQFSPFTLNGQRLLGAGVELNPGKWHLGFIYGRIQKAITLDTLYQSPIPGTYHPDSYFKRMGYAIKAGYGRPDTAFIGLSYFHASDVNDQTILNLSQSIFPAENSVLGISAKLRLFKRLLWHTELAASGLTRNTLADTLSLGDEKLLKNISSLFSIRESTQGFLAGESSLTWQAPVFSLGLKYRRIDPGFTTFGAYYLQTDVVQYSVNPGLRLANLQLQGTVGWQEDNLKKLKSRSSERFIGSLFMDWQFSKWSGVSVAYSNFGFTQSPLTRNLVDTTLLEQVNQSIAIIPRFNIIKTNLVHAFQVSLNYNELADLRREIFAPVDLKSLQFNGSHNLSFSHQNLNAGWGIFYHHNDAGFYRFNSLGGQLQLGKSIPRINTSLQGQLVYFRNDFSTAETSSTWQSFLQLSVPVVKNQIIHLGIQWLSNQPSTQGSTLNPAFNEWRFRTGYTFQFSKQLFKRK